MQFILHKRIILFAAAAYFFHPNHGMAQHAAAANVCQTSKSLEDKTQCLVDASKKADQQLNQVYGVLRKKLPSETFQKLQTAQRLWVQFRDADCQADYPVELPGSPRVAHSSPRLA